MRLCRALGAIVAMVVFAASVGVATASAGAGVPRPDFEPAASGPPLLGGPQVPGAGGTLAGYVRDGVIRSIGASWRVPTVARDSRPGAAFTWIGAEAPSTGGNSPFIQIGTIEQELITPAHPKGTAVYSAFWSDPAVDFRPVILFGVHAGDPITASMRLSGDGEWTLQLTDHRTRRTRTLRRRQRADFNYGLWMQKDPTAGVGGGALSYPDVSGPRFSGLRLDGAQPVNTQVLSTWMALPGGYLGPSPLRDGAFAIVPQRLSRIAAAFERISLNQVRADDFFGSELYYWTARTPVAEVERETDRFEKIVARTLSSYRARPWPRTVAPLIRQVEAYEAYETAHLDAAARHGALAVSGVFRVDDRIHPDVILAIRKLLHVRELDY